MNDSPKRSAAVALAALLFVFLLACSSIARLQPPPAVPADAPPQLFSSGRAMRHLREITRAPHPAGSAEAERVRDYIVAELAASGLVAEVQRRTVVREGRQQGGQPALVADVENIVARLKGTANSRAVMLAAHYDSVPTGPGATDDGAGVVTLLETLRALRSAPPLKNDIILLFTDGEEYGLLGAEAFAEGHAWMRDVGLVLNFEGRGAGGPSVMFETSEENGRLVREFARSAPRPVASSLMYAFYKLLPNDTDMTVFKRAGAAGLNFAYADRITHYHTQLDSADELDERSLQHHGSYALGLSRHFGGLDPLRAEERGDAVYFDLFSLVLVNYGDAWVVPLTVFITLLFVCVVGLGLKRRRLSVRGIVGGLLLLFAITFGAGLSASVVVWALRLASGGHHTLPWGVPYNSRLFETALVVLTLGVAAILYALFYRKTRTENLLAGALSGWLILLLAVSFLLPAASYLFAWPLLSALCGLFYLVFAKEGAEQGSWKGFAVVSASSAPAVLLVVPVIYLLFVMIGMGQAALTSGLTALLCGLLVAQLRLGLATRPWLLPAAAVALALGLFIFGLSTNGPDARRRRVNNLFYVLDADTGAARWLSTDRATDSWTSQFLTATPEREPLAHLFPWSRQTVLKNVAPPAPLAAPEIEVLAEEREGEVRTVRLRIRSPRRARMMWLYAAPETVTLAASVNGQSVTPAGPPEGTKNLLRLSYVAVPAEGFELSLRARGPLKLTVIDGSDELPTLPGRAFPQRPDWMMPAPSPRSDTTLVSKTFVL